MKYFESIKFLLEGINKMVSFRILTYTTITFIQFNLIKIIIILLSPFQLMDLVQELMQFFVVALKLPNSGIFGISLTDP